MKYFIEFKDGKMIDPPSPGSWECRADGLYPRDAQTAAAAGLGYPVPKPVAPQTAAPQPAAEPAKTK